MFLKKLLFESLCSCRWRPHGRNKE